MRRASPVNLHVFVYRLGFSPSPACQQCWIVFTPQPVSLCCGWRLESWPIVVRTLSISCWHLAANNESIWGLHLKPLSLPASCLSSTLFFSFILLLQSLTCCVRPSVSRTLNCILTDGAVRLAKVLAIKEELAVWATSDGVCYQCQSVLHCSSGHLHFVLRSRLQLWHSNSRSFTAQVL